MIVFSKQVRPILIVARGVFSGMIYTLCGYLDWDDSVMGYINNFYQKYVARCSSYRTRKQSRKGNKRLGIVLGVSSLRLLEVTVFSSRDIEITGFAYINFNKKDRARAFNKAQISEWLAQALADQGVTTKLVSLAISLDHVVTSTIVVGSDLSSLEIDTLIEHTLEQYIPYRREAIYYDYCRQSPQKVDDPVTQVSLVAARSEPVNAQLDIVRGAGLIPHHVDIDVLAMQRALQYRMCVTDTPDCSWFNQAFLLLEIDQSMLRLFLVSKAASEVRWKGSTPLMAGVTQERICSILQRLLSVLDQETQCNAKYEIVLMGENLDNDIAYRIQHCMGLATSVLDPFVGFSTRPGLHPQTLQNIAPTMLTAIGLVLRKG